MGQTKLISRRIHRQSTVAYESKGDPQLIAAVRAGDAGAFSALYGRHRTAAQFVAAAQTDNASDAEDVVAEAFASVFKSLTESKGPDEFFRAYLLTVVRRMAHGRNKLAARTAPTDDDGQLDTAVTDADPVISAFESTTMARAFKSLPERWQSVLWYMDIEQMKPAAAAGYIGLSANGASSLLVRAREGLRQAYLQQHIALPENDPCAEYANQLGKLARKKLNRGQKEKVETHVEGCAKCTALLFDLNDIQSAMRAALIPLVTGLPAGTALQSGLLSTAAVHASAASSGATSSGTASSGAASGHWAGAGRWLSNNHWTTAGVAVGGVVVVGAASALALASVLSTKNTVATPAPPSATQPLPNASQVPAPPPPTQALEEPQPTASSQANPSLPAAQQTPAPTASSTATAPTAASKAPVLLPSLPPLPAKAPEPGPVVTKIIPEPTIMTWPSQESVTALFTLNERTRSFQKELNVVFSLQNGGSLRTGEVIFNLSPNVQFVPGKVLGPAGWTCTQAYINNQEVRCSSSSPDPKDLKFALGISGLDVGEQGTVSYTFSGDGIDSSTFTNSFGFLPSQSIVVPPTTVE